MRTAGFVVFLAIVFTINLALHGYLWWRLVRSPGWPAPWTRVGTVATFSLAVALSASLVLMRIAPRTVTVPLAWIGFVWLGLLFYFFVLLLAAEPLRPLLRTWAAPGFAGVAGLTATRWVARCVALGVLVGGCMIGAVAIFSARLPASVRTVPVSLSRWPVELSGYTVVQLSDIHVGGTVGRGFVERIARRVNSLDPDMIVITGDLVDGSVEELAPLVAPLASLRARDGVWFATGNHDTYSGADAWIDHLRSLGIRVLRNERVAIRGDRGFDLAGTDDYAAHGSGHSRGQDIPRAMAGRDPDRPVILLAHQPRSFPEAVAHRVDLQLSGHTHGGQIYPFHYLTRSVQPYLAGLHRRGASTIYVSRGTGYWGPPMRLGAPAEITKIVLTP
jgi:predicted MPP superfamily phosphohydrolase